MIFEKTTGIKVNIGSDGLLVKTHASHIFPMIILLFYILVYFVAQLNYVIPYADYLDDYLALLVIVVSAVKGWRGSSAKVTISLLSALVVIGILSNIISGYHKSILGIIYDIFSLSKYFLVYCSVLSCFDNTDTDFFLVWMVRFFKLLVVALSVTYLLMWLGVVQGTAEGYSRFGLPVLTVFGSHPSFCAAVGALATCVFLSNRKYKTYAVLGIIVCLGSLRAKALIFTMVIIYVLIFSKRKLSFWNALAILGIIAFVLADFFFAYYEGSRGIALRTSYAIAARYFPLGSGFATFGTVMSARYYSDVYFDFGLSNRWGFSIYNSSWVGDGGFATIIGQFGWLGFAIFGLLIFYTYRHAYRVSNTTSSRLPVIGLCAYMLISSTNEIAYTSQAAVLFAITMAVLTKSTIDNMGLRSKANKFGRRS
jgi:hypothetical protein